MCWCFLHTQEGDWGAVGEVQAPRALVVPLPQFVRRVCGIWPQFPPAFWNEWLQGAGWEPHFSPRSSVKAFVNIADSHLCSSQSRECVLLEGGTWELTELFQLLCQKRWRSDVFLSTAAFSNYAEKTRGIVCTAAWACNDLRGCSGFQTEKKCKGETLKQYQ